MQRRKFHMMGAGNLTGSPLSDDNNQIGTPNNSTKIETEFNSIPVITQHTFYITEGFIKQPDEKLVYFRGFSQNDTTLEVPAQPFVIRQGEEVTIIIKNTLTTEHSFIIDGIVDSGVIKAGESKAIIFTTHKKGSYLFYDGLNAPFNRLSGLHGGMEVIATNNNKEEKNHLKFKQNLFKVISDIDPSWHNEFKNNIIPTTPFTPSYFTINGLSIKVLKKTSGQSDLIIQKKTKEYMENRTLYAGINTQALH